MFRRIACSLSKISQHLPAGSPRRSGGSRRHDGRSQRQIYRERSFMPNRSFWNRRRVLLTGHTGFKGSWLTLWLNALGANVTGYALAPPTEPNLFSQADVAATVNWIRADT